MNFGFSEEQDLLRQQVRKFLDEQSPLEVVRQIAETPAGYLRSSGSSWASSASSA